MDLYKYSNYILITNIANFMNYMDVSNIFWFTGKSPNNYNPTKELYVCIGSGWSESGVFFKPPFGSWHINKYIANSS